MEQDKMKYTSHIVLSYETLSPHCSLKALISVSYVLPSNTKWKNNKNWTSKGPIGTCEWV